MELFAFLVIVGLIVVFGLLCGVFSRLGDISHLLATQNWLLANPAPVCRAKGAGPFANQLPNRLLA